MGPILRYESRWSRWWPNWLPGRSLGAPKAWRLQWDSMASPLNQDPLDMPCGAKKWPKDFGPLLQQKVFKFCWMGLWKWHPKKRVHILSHNMLELFWYERVVYHLAWTKPWICSNETMVLSMSLLPITKGCLFHDEGRSESAQANAQLWTMVSMQRVPPRKIVDFYLWWGLTTTIAENNCSGVGIKEFWPWGCI